MHDHLSGAFASGMKVHCEMSGGSGIGGRRMPVRTNVLDSS